MFFVRLFLSLLVFQLSLQPVSALPSEEGFGKHFEHDRLFQDEGFQSYNGPDLGVLLKGQLPNCLPEGTWIPSEEAIEKVPGFLGVGKPNKKGQGFRWIGRNGANQVRIDRGDPSSDYAHQRVDHVRINSEGKMMNKDGKLLPGGSTSDKAELHIPLSEWQTWKKWDEK